MFYAYYRVSTETQAEKGGGLETQRQNIEKYCIAHGITLDGEFTDAGISGALKDTDADDAISKRPALIEMLATVQDGDTVIVLNTSRLWRSDTAKVVIRRELMKIHAHVIAVDQPRFDLYTKNPYDRFFDSVVESVDELEREIIALRLSKGRAAKAMNGDKPAGVVPFGYQYTSDKKHVAVDPAEAATVRLMFTEAQKGNSLQKIAETLNKREITTRAGKPWTRGLVHSILHNRFYTGELTYQGKTIPGNHDAIISRVQFGKVAAQLERRRH